jgi:hypothetical protein
MQGSESGGRSLKLVEQFELQRGEHRFVWRPFRALFSFIICYPRHPVSGCLGLGSFGPLGQGRGWHSECPSRDCDMALVSPGL